MNKRSAMIVAAGLIVALVAGAYALAVGVTGPATSASAKDSRVKTTTKTVTVHKQAPSAAGTSAMSAPLVTRSSGGKQATGSYRGYFSGGSLGHFAQSASSHHDQEHTGGSGDGGRDD